MKRGVALAVLLIFAGTNLAHAGDYDPLHQRLGTLPDFKLTDQDGNIVQREQLLGKVCVISVFFSCCSSICPQTQQAMAGLQEKFASYPDVLLVSINVYPGHDTPTVVSQYAKSRQANPARWLFLHGDKKEIYDLVKKGLFQGLEENTSAEPGNEVLHTPNFVVVDHRGSIRGYANGMDRAEVGRLEEFVKQLVQAKYFPTVNAGLNASSGMLLLLGFLFIRRRWITAHKIVMLSALGVSAVFLGSYLYYHFAVLDGEPTRFGGEGPIRSLYLGILLSHTVLAVAVAPMALRVTYLGLRNRLVNHKILARWTLPAWLYVSVTGVVVYWMLYHLYPPV